MDGTTHVRLRPPVASHRVSVHDWEEWEDDQVVTPVDADEPPFAPAPPPPTGTRQRSQVKSSASRHSSARINRLRSRRRQKAQNAKAGIKLITDMTVFKRNNNNNTNSNAPSVPAAESRPAAKFVDAAALRALEGEPSSASIGSWNWLRREESRSPARAAPGQPAPGQPAPGHQELSPDDRPIVIGISLPSDQMSSRDVSPQTATGQTLRAAPDADAHVQRSVWSPDTPDTVYSFDHRNTASSMASQASAPPPPGFPGADRAPPVPALPADLDYRHHKAPQHGLAGPESGENNQAEDDNGTPCTLFEEDGNATLHKPTLARGLGHSPDSASPRSNGWWDHVVTPFLDKKHSLLSSSSRKAKVDSPRDGVKSPCGGLGIAERADRPSTGPLLPVHAPIVREPSPRRGQSPSPSLQSSLSSLTSPPRQGRLAASREALRRSLVPAATERVHAELPPPYSPPKKQAAAPARFRAVFPSQHPLHAQFPPSPFPASPGLGATMTSQGATQMANIPLTPADRSETPPLPGFPLPTRPPGTFVPLAHAHDAAGRAHKVERQRRRHEKEDAVARRVGGLWRGRACVPASGCFGRSGREGRRRRRAWLALWAGVTSLLILTIVLVVVLTRRHHDAPGQERSMWVNLTGFPPMPTGALTAVGLDNTVSRSACTEPSTLWSCSLPKEEHEAAAPYRPNQPTVVMQILWDNGTDRSRVNKPEPGAPDIKEMWFLGNTTDNVQSDNKAGEPTPFYISLSGPAPEPAADSTLRPRAAGPQIGNESLEHLLPPPELEADGTPAAAVMIPRAARQPVRLFDRGLATEHFGFYAHFKRTIFLRSVTILNKTEGSNIPLDEDGGCRKDEADYLVTWGETRVLVQIWTRALELNASSLLRPDGGGGGGGGGVGRRPGTMPYPVTVTLDTHGGDPNKKVVWGWPVDKRQRVVVSKPELLVNRMGAAGTWINPRGTGDAALGGFDGGTGGCRCEWANWVQRAS